MQRVEVPVLVVGAGPVGMTASLLLAQQGIASLVVDRRPGPHRAPQAHVVNPRTLEILRGAGVDAAALRAHATRREDGSHVAWVTTLSGEELGRLPYERQGDDAFAYTPTPLLNLPQHRLEPVLLDHLRASRGDVRYRHEWTALVQDADGVTARIHDVEASREYEVRSQWLLAADGAGSRVRRALGIDMIGPDRLQSFVMIHFEANLRPLVRERPAIIYWTRRSRLSRRLRGARHRAHVGLHAPVGSRTAAGRRVHARRLRRHRAARHRPGGGPDRGPRREPVDDDGAGRRRNTAAAASSWSATARIASRLRAAWG